jgi:VanZ family protein
MNPARLPPLLKALAYMAAVAVLLWLCLAPSSALPQPPNLSDKLEHAIAWFVLTALGLLFWPASWRRVALFALGLGLAIEGLQMAAGFGRQGDWLDFAADAVGVLVALAVFALLRRRLDPA